ncbi:MAG: PQQ-dependent sugar dehydrogenase [Limnochordales bacterium]
MLVRRITTLVLLAAAGVAVWLFAGPPPTESQAQFQLALVADGFNSPVHLTSPPDGTGRLFVVDRIGVVYIIDAEGRLLPEPFLDLRDALVPLRSNFDERGLLGLAFHPGFAQNGRFFVYYSAPRRPEAPANWDHTARIAEFRVSPDNPNRADRASERVVLEIDQPQFNHNGGALAFGPDGYLYISLGDGGGANDVGVGHGPMGNGQDINTLLGKILRIDVDGGDPYGIPPDNPFVGQEGRDEIYAWGFRNPFRMSFDRGGDRELFVADVGQANFEEVNIVNRPGNYGWRIKEGTHWFDPDRPDEVITEGPTVGPRGEPLIDPIIEYRNRGSSPDGVGVSVIGGYVYRGSAIPELYGRYVFADWSRAFNRGAGVIMTAERPAEPGAMWPWQIVMELEEFILGLGEDADGELYVLTTEQTGPVGNTGKVYKIVPASP